MSKDPTPSEPLFLKRCGFPQFLFMRLLGVYFLLSDIAILIAGAKGLSPRKNWQDFIRLFPTAWMVLFYVLLFCGITFLYSLFSKKQKTLAECFDPALLVLSVIYFSCSLVWRGGDFFLAVVVGLFALVFVVYGISRINPDLLNRSGHEYTVILPVAAISIVVLVFICETALAIHRIYGTTTFDMGIFDQSFYSMSQRLSPVATCERGYALSHFRVHTSFILYLLLPVYKLFPGAETLIVSQAVMVVSGVIPVYLIAGKRNFSGATRFFCCMIYLFALGILSPCYFNFHENAFLPPLLMWLFYAVESKKNILFCIMSALVCTVKEDATLFVICICLYLFFETKGKDRLRVVLTGGASTVYFLIVSAWLSHAGDGNMILSSRMHALMIEENQSALQLIGNMLSNPGYALTVVTTQPDAFLILLEMLLPLLLIPFFTKKTHRLFLMVPFFVFNLLISASYAYVAQIQFQYAFGPAALLVYLTIINISDFEKEKRTVLVSAVAVTSVIASICMCSVNLKQYEQYKANKETYQNIEACFKTIPQDASVTSSENYLPHLSRRDEVYEITNDNYVIYGSNVVSLQNVNMTDYYVLDFKNSLEVKAGEILKSKGYTEFTRYEDYVVVFKKGEA